MLTVPCRRPVIIRTFASNNCKCSRRNSAAIKVGSIFPNTSGTINFQVSPLAVPDGDPISEGVYLTLSWQLTENQIFPSANEIGEFSSEFVEGFRVGHRAFLSYGNIGFAPIETKEITSYFYENALYEMTVTQSSADSPATAFLTINNRPNAFLKSFQCSASFWDEFAARIQTTRITTTKGSGPTHGSMQPVEPQVADSYNRTAIYDLGELDVFRSYTQPRFNILQQRCTCSSFPQSFASLTLGNPAPQNDVSLRTAGGENKLQLEHDIANKAVFAYHSSSHSRIMAGYPGVTGDLVVAGDIAGGSVQISNDNCMPGLFRGVSSTSETNVTDSRVDTTEPDAAYGFFDPLFIQQFFLGWYYYSVNELAAGNVDTNALAANLNLLRGFYTDFLDNGTALPWAGQITNIFGDWWSSLGFQKVILDAPIYAARNNPNAQETSGAITTTTTSRNTVLILSENGSTTFANVGIDADEFTAEEIEASQATAFTKQTLLSGTDLPVAYRTFAFASRIRVTKYDHQETLVEQRLFYRTLGPEPLTITVLSNGSPSAYIVGLPWTFGSKETTFQETGQTSTTTGTPGGYDYEVHFLQPSVEDFGVTTVQTGPFSISPA